MKVKGLYERISGPVVLSRSKGDRMSALVRLTHHERERGCVAVTPITWVSL